MHFGGAWRPIRCAAGGSQTSPPSWAPRRGRFSVVWLECRYPSPASWPKPDCRLRHPTYAMHRVRDWRRSVSLPAIRIRRISHARSAKPSEQPRAPTVLISRCRPSPTSLLTLARWKTCRHPVNTTWKTYRLIRQTAVGPVLATTSSGNTWMPSGKTTIPSAKTAAADSSRTRPARRQSPARNGSNPHHSTIICAFSMYYRRLRNHKPALSLVRLASQRLAAQPPFPDPTAQGPEAAAVPEVPQICAPVVSGLPAGPVEGSPAAS